MTATQRVFTPIPVVAQSKACVCEHSLFGIAGLSLVSVKERTLRRADPSSKELVPSVNGNVSVFLYVGLGLCFCVIESDQMQLKPLHLQSEGRKGQTRKGRKAG